MGLTAILSQILGPVLRPIIKDELKEIKQSLLIEKKLLNKYKEIDKESDELIRLAEDATTTEEAKAHLRRLRSTRARIND